MNARCCCRRVAIPSGDVCVTIVSRASKSLAVLQLSIDSSWSKHGFMAKKSSSPICIASFPSVEASKPALVALNTAISQLCNSSLRPLEAVEICGKW